MFELWKKAVIFNFYAVKARKGQGPGAAVSAGGGPHAAAGGATGMISYSDLMSDSGTFASHYTWSKILNTTCADSLDEFIIYLMKRSE